MKCAAPTFAEWPLRPGGPGCGVPGFVRAAVDPRRPNSPLTGQPRFCRPPGSGHRDILNQESARLIIPTAAIGKPDAALRDMPKAEEVA
jgi:hypothetical protein